MIFDFLLMITKPMRTLESLRAYQRQIAVDPIANFIQ
jgi:hypothetical protein